MVSSGVSPCNRAAWAILKWKDDWFDICSVYAPNDYKDVLLWKWMFNLQDIPWIIGGDFNFIEKGEDK